MKKYIRIIALCTIIQILYLKNIDDRIYTLYYTKNSIMDLILNGINFNTYIIYNYGITYQIYYYIIYVFIFLYKTNKKYHKGQEKIIIINNTPFNLEFYNNNNNTKKLIIINHGLTGGTGFHFKIYINKLLENGFNICIIWRSGKLLDYFFESDNNTFNYKFDTTDELDKIIKFIINEYKQYTKLYLLNYSAGCLAPVKYLINTQYIKPEQLKGCICVSTTNNIKQNLLSLPFIFFHGFKYKLNKIISEEIKKKYKLNNKMNVMEILGNIGRINKAEIIISTNISNMSISKNMFTFNGDLHSDVKELSSNIPYNIRYKVSNNNWDYDANVVLKYQEGTQYNFTIEGQHSIPKNSHIEIIKIMSIDEYYNDLEIDLNKINNIKIPLLFINAEDDGITPYNENDMNKLIKNPNIGFFVTKQGWHTFFHNGEYENEYLPKLIIDFFNRL